MKRDEALEVEITIAPAKRRKGGRDRRRSAPTEPDPPRIPRIARLMALAIKFQEMIDRGEVRNYADLARLGYVTRARMTQIMNLLNLAPEIQEQILLLSRDGSVAERDLRPLTAAVLWEQQGRLWRLRKRESLACGPAKSAMVSPHAAVPN